MTKKPQRTDTFYTSDQEDSTLAGLVMSGVLLAGIGGIIAAVVLAKS